MLREGRKSTKIKKKAVWTGVGGGRVLERFIGREGRSIGRQNWWVAGSIGVQGSGAVWEVPEGGGLIWRYKEVVWRVLGEPLLSTS